MNLKFFLSSTVRTFFSFTIIAHTAQAMADVVINEIHYHPPSQDQAEEFIELHNAGTSPVELNGWRLEVGIDFIFEGTSVIEPG
ncbi:MAG: lamin tail domain-containing protein, partial [Candidatus Omnitrophica bacterium]|nr:lamin tail domain-containing protein [Candidatus Omnitrophota bacterium]